MVLSSRSGSLEPDTTPTSHDSSSRASSLTPSVLDYRYENGRRYHAYKDGAYQLPNDEPEANRLNLQHRLFRLTIGDRLHLAPIPDDVQDVLDVGCGTGMWAIEFADEYPSTRVLGVDLSPIQPTEIPANCSFLVDDAEAEWTYDKKFDFIHSRAVCTGIKDWPRYIEQAYKNLKPGGYIELQEVSVPPRCDDGSAPPDSAIIGTANLMAKAAGMTGLDMQAPARFPDLLRDAGFEDIQVNHFKWPIGPWAKGERQKILGRMALHDCLESLPAGCMALFTRVLKFTPDEVEMRLEATRDELKAQTSHCYMPISFTYARKPLGGL